MIGDAVRQTIFPHKARYISGMDAGMLVQMFPIGRKQSRIIISFTESQNGRRWKGPLWVI